MVPRLWKGWQHCDGKGMWGVTWTHPKLFGVIRRWDGHGGIFHDASARLGWQEKPGGWVITIGRDDTGVFPTLRQAQIHAQRCFRNSEASDAAATA
jgi:hypothetical protein